MQNLMYVRVCVCVCVCVRTYLATWFEFRIKVIIFYVVTFYNTRTFLQYNVHIGFSMHARLFSLV